MPTYDYRCNDCNHEFEMFQSIKAEAHKDCPQCGANGSVERLISAGNGGLIFKGSGFYVTDYKSNSTKDSAEKKKPAKKEESKKDTKPETSG